MLFKPGNSIHLDAGGVDKAETLFDGIIVGLRILTGNDSRSYMVVECRDNAYAATQGRKNRIFEKKKDADIIKEVLAAYGSVDVDTTPYFYQLFVCKILVNVSENLITIHSVNCTSFIKCFTG